MTWVIAGYIAAGVLLLIGGFIFLIRWAVKKAP